MSSEPPSAGPAGAWQPQKAGDEKLDKDEIATRFREHPASKHVGPEVSLPYCYRSYTVDEQLSNASDKMIDAKKEKEVPEVGVLPYHPTHFRGKSGTPTTMGLMSKAKRKKIVDKATGSKPDAATEVKKIFIPDADNRFREMVRFIEVDNHAEEEQKAIELATSHGQVASSSSKSGSNWSDEFRTPLDSSLQQIRMTLDPVLGELQIQRTYEWFLTHKLRPQNRGLVSARSPGAEPRSDLNFLDGEVERSKSRPGSAFYVKPSDGYGDVDDEAEVEKQISVAVNDGGMASRLMNVQLPPARERLRTFETKQLVSPLTARKLKAATRDDCYSPDMVDRPFTPSTCTGGSSTARSGYSASSARSTPTPLGYSSARSSPTPLGGSRPSSAAGSYSGAGRRPLTAQSQREPNSGMVRPPLSARPGTAPGSSGARPPIIPATAKEPRAEGAAVSSGAAESAKQEILLRQALQKEAEERQVAQAQQNMEERWLMRRHRDIANQIVDEDRHAAVAVWAERRARVEEEIAYNAEAMRFQCELSLRALSLPADAEEDIPATVPDDELPDLRDAKGGNQKQASASTLPPPRIDVSKISSEKVRFAQEALVSPRLKSSTEEPTKLDRIASLRFMNRHLLQGSEVEDDDYEGGADTVPESIFQTEVRQNTHAAISLSVYTPDSSQAPVTLRNHDDADIVAAMCDHWSERQLYPKSESEVGTVQNLHEMRFKQMQEAEAVKRMLAKRNCPFNAAVVESALVMPSHSVKLGHCIFNTEPNLKTDRLPAWYQQDRQKKKKPGKGGRKGAAAKGGRKSKSKR